jgi:hypothetical protein
MNVGHSRWGEPLEYVVLFAVIVALGLTRASLVIWLAVGVLYVVAMAALRRLRAPRGRV